MKAILQRKESEKTVEEDIFEFTIGKFHLNSKLRHLTFDGQEAIKLSPKDNFITYHNIEKTLSKMDKILNEFSFTSFERFLKNA